MKFEFCFVISYLYTGWFVCGCKACDGYCRTPPAEREEVCNRSPEELQLLWGWDPDSCVGLTSSISSWRIHVCSYKLCEAYCSLPIWD